MNRKRFPFNRRLSIVATSVLKQVDDIPVKGGWLRCYQRFGFVNPGTKANIVRFAFGGTNPEQFISEFDADDGDKFVWDRGPVWMREEQYMRAIPQSSASGDQPSLHVSGFDIEIGPKD